MKSVRNSIPDDVYVGFVRSLYHDASILLIGAACHFLIAFLVYDRTREPTYLLLGFAMLIAGLYRYWRIREGRGGVFITDYAAAVKWERHYLVGGTVQGFAVGMFGLVTTYAFPDAFGELAAVAVILGSTVTISRNYGSRSMVIILSVAAVLPISVGMMLKGDLDHVILGLYIIPLVVIITRLATSVRTVLFTAITEEKKANELAQRFNRALNTMSHGLIMLGPDGKVVVANAEAAALLSLASPDLLLGRSLRSLLMRGVAGGMLTVKDSRYVEIQLTRALRKGQDRKVLIGLSNGQFYEFSAREGRQDLGVITFEDVTQRIQAEEKIRTMARFDNLTGLANRAYFHELAAEIDGGRQFPAALCARRLRPRRFQVHQRHARSSGRRRPDLCGRRTAGGIQRRRRACQPLRRRRIHRVLRPDRR